MKSSTKLSIPLPPDMPPKSIYMLYIKEAQVEEKTSLVECGKGFKALSEKEKSSLEERLKDAKAKYDKDYSKWLDSAKEKGFPNYPMYPRKVLKKKYSDKASKEGLDCLRLAGGAFLAVMNDSLLKYAKEKKVKKIDPEFMLKFIDADPDKVLEAVKESKAFDSIIGIFKKACNIDEDDSEDDGKKGKKDKEEKKKKGKCSS